MAGEENKASGPANNVPEFSVSEISGALKRTVEGAFSRVRVRGELSRVTVARSGHIYTQLKDENAVLDSVCWKGQAARLSVAPEEGLEVICTGRLTTYPGRSNYQLVIESMELAGEGALLKLLEDRRKRLAAEGLFDEARKRDLPFLPSVIGVVTSPTGAVIRDILHRLADRFPRHVLVWPVNVQGEGAAPGIAAAIEGFNALADMAGNVPRPDVLIVARGGGSLEDLMAFNDEAVVRAAAASAIPLISAVGHETDTTLIDFAADRRAPTPTAAAEMAVPVRAQLAAWITELGGRLTGAANKRVEFSATCVEGLARGLGDPARLLETAMQRLDDRATRLSGGVAIRLERAGARLAQAVARMRSPHQRLGDMRERLAGISARLDASVRNSPERAAERLEGMARRLAGLVPLARLEDAATRLDQAGMRSRRAMDLRLEKAGECVAARAALLDSYSHHSVLRRGFALVRDMDGNLLRSADAAREAGRLRLSLADGEVEADVAGPAARTPAKKSARKAPRKQPVQTSLFGNDDV